MDYEKLSVVFKALANQNRLMIVNMLSCGEMCACDILEYFDFTQPTLSHHMKVLETAEVIVSEKRGKWIHYSLSESFANQFTSNVEEIVLNNGEDCICHEIERNKAVSAKEKL